jgi:mono/diheme cytochrome c family protein
MMERLRAGWTNAGEAEGWSMALGSWGRRRKGNFLRYAIACAMVAACGLLVMSGGQRSSAQETKSAAAAQASGDQVARGKYIVEDVAMCGTCHTPRLPNGQLDRSQWLAGAPVPYLPARPTADWPINAPRLAGTPPATNAAMVMLLTTTVWTDGKQLRDPMPKFHMTRADAEAVVAYLRSLR